MSDSNSGVRNLRAMFENQSTASSPEPRGRSPAKFNADPNAPATSKIRASFVSVEPSAHVAARDLGATKGTTDGLNSPTAHRRESFSLSADADDDAIAELKKEVSHEKEERKNSTAVPETIPEQAVATRESSQAPPPIRELQSTMPNLGSITKGSDFPDPQAAAEEKSDIAEESTVEEPAHDVAAPEPPSDDIANKLADLSLADVPADNPDKIVSGAQEEASLKPADPKEEAAVSGGQALPPPTDVLPSSNSIAASESVASVFSTTPVPETNATSESMPAPVAAVEAPEVAEITPDTDVIDDAPAVEVVEDIPATEAVEDIPATEVVEDIPATEVLEDIPATEVVEDTPATEVVENALEPDITESAPVTQVTGSSATEGTESAPVTEPAENTSSPQPADNASFDSVADTTLSVKSAETAPPPPEVAESIPTNKDNGTSSNHITNGRAQKPSAISTTKAGPAKTSSSKNPLPQSPELARVPKTPTTPKRHVPLSSAKSPAPAKNSPKAAVSKDTAAPTKVAAAPKASSKAAVSKEHPKASAPAARTSRSVPRQSTSASTAGTLAKGKTPVVENKVPAARSSSAVPASRERKAPTAAASKDPKATTAAASKDSKSTTAAAHKDSKPTNTVASKAPKAATAAASKDSKEAAKAHTTSPGGFKKPRPKSPTKPVGLPSRLTAPTAASSAKQGEDAKVTRKPSTASRPTQPRAAAAAPAAKKPARASLAPSTAPAKRPESRASTAGGANEGFLARMMRPTTSSASKTHEKPASPPRRGASVKTASKTTTGQESTVAKGKKKVSEVAHKAKEAITNGHTDEHAASEDSGPGAAENTVAGSANDEIPEQSPADQTQALPGQSEEPEQPEQPVESIVVPEDTKIAT